MTLPSQALVSSPGLFDPPVNASGEVDVRCPLGPHKLLAKVRIPFGSPLVTTNNLLEISCQDCRKRLRIEGSVVRIVLHRFNIVGDLVETEIVPES